MNILIFGGSFDPVHNGHIRLLGSMLACERLAVDKALIMPAYVSPFKLEKTGGASPQDRLEMCRLSFGDIPCAEISDHEINSGGISYTADTAEHLRRIYPDDELILALGGDSLRSFPRWRRFRDIMKICTVAAAARCRAEKEEILALAERLGEFGRVEAVDSEPFEISSTQIREMISRGEDVGGYIPPAEAEYIQKKHIYR